MAGPSDFPAPRFGTERNPQRATNGHKVRAVGQALGHEHMPWQAHVDDIAAEIDPATGGPWYRTVILVVTRQEGKTTIVVDTATTAALMKSDDFLVYTAQNRLKALNRLELNFYRPVLRAIPSVLEPRKDKRRPGWVGKTGDEHIAYINGTRLAIDAVKDDAGHGATTGRAFIDEAFVHRDGTLEGGIAPTMLTRADAQMWITSAAGEDKDRSRYLWEKVQLGRALIESGVKDSRIAYFEWSDDDGDRADPATWARCLPALGHTVTLETVAAEFERMQSEPDQFDRAYLGRWPGAKRPDPEIPVAAWRAIISTRDEPIDFDSRRPVYVVDTSPDREWTSVSITGTSTDAGAIACSRLAGYEHGTAWAPGFLDELRSRFGGDTVYIAGDGAAASLAPKIEARGFKVVLVGSADIANACGAHYDAVLSGEFRTIDDKDLNNALANAVKRALGDRWRWWRGKSLGDISPLYAVALGFWGFNRSSEDDYDVTTSVM